MGSFFWKEEEKVLNSLEALTLKWQKINQSENVENKIEFFKIVLSLSVNHVIFWTSNIFYWKEGKLKNLPSITLKENIKPKV